MFPEGMFPADIFHDNITRQICIAMGNNNYCVEYIRIADTYSLPTSTAVIHTFIASNFAQLADRHADELMEFSASQLGSWLADDNLVVPSECSLFELVVRWVRFDVTSREQHLAQLISRVRLPLCSLQELEETVCVVDIVMRNDECRELVNEALQYHADVYKQPVLQTPRTQVRLLSSLLLGLPSYNLY